MGLAAMKYYLLLLALLMTANLLAVDHRNLTKPLSQRYSLLPFSKTAKLRLPDIDLAEFNNKIPLKSDNPKQNIRRPLQISHTNKIEQTLSDFGQWQSVNNESIWRLNISAINALHLNFGFKNFHLPDSARLYILDANSSQVLKQYSSKDNKFHGELWTPLFETKDIIIEINLKTIDKAQLSLTLVQAGQGIKSVNPTQLNTKSGDCNIDVICPEGIGWENELRSVARYIISDTTGTFFCTGTLINNTKGDLTPLFLTAAHCLVSDTTASSMVFYWNYETSVCAGTPDGATNQNQTGANLVSRWEGVEGENSDFALVRLDQAPDSNFNVYFSGWDNRNQTHTGVIGIHHPQGGEKRVSVENDPLTITHYADNIINPAGNFLRVQAWDQGTTEGGSSGSSLWNTNHHIIGTLSGGAASCTTQTESDWYGRLAAHWLGNNFKSNQLAPYLAPHIDSNSSLESTLDGSEHCSVPMVSINPSTITPSASEQFTLISHVSGGTAPYSYEWDFDNDGSIDSTDANPTHSIAIPSHLHVQLVVRDSLFCPGVSTSTVFVADPTEVFIADGQVPAGFSKPDTAVGSWVPDATHTSEGLFSLKSQIVNGDNKSVLEFSGEFDAGNISFDRKVSSENTFDFLKFFIDNNEQFSISGEQDWSNINIPVSAGSHTFRWSYEKDAAVSDGEDAAWIDNLQLPPKFTPAPAPAPTPVPAPTAKSGGGGTMWVLTLGLLLLLSGLGNRARGYFYHPRQ